MQPAARGLTLALAVRRAAPSASVPAPAFPSRRIPLLRPPAHHTLQQDTDASPAETGATAPPLSAPPAPKAPVPAGLAHLKSRRLISVAGPDSVNFLQGLITGNLFHGPPQEHSVIDAPGLHTAFLTAQGRVRNDVFIYRDTSNLSRRPSPSPSSAFLIEVDVNQSKSLSALLRRHKLRSRIEIRLLEEDEASIHHLWSTNSSPSLPGGESVVSMRDIRAGGLGWRILTRDPLTSDKRISEPVVSEADYHLRRYLHGIAEGQAEMPDGQALPLESNLDIPPGAIDFHKGCYVGQELTIRTRHRGVVRKRILPCVLYAAGEEPPAGFDERIYRPEIRPGLDASQVATGLDIGCVSNSGRTPGKWLKGMGNVGLALVRLERMTDLRPVKGDVAAGMYKEGDEFKVTAAGVEELRVKAFVPNWLRDALSR